MWTAATGCSKRMCNSRPERHGFCAPRMHLVLRGMDAEHGSKDQAHGGLDAERGDRLNQAAVR